MLLAGDVGGTKSHLAIFDPKDVKKIIKEKKYHSHQWDGLMDIVNDFLRSIFK